MNRLNQFDVEQLLAERPFEMLTAAEQEAVQSQMPEWEYQRLHQLLQRSKAAMKRSPKPNPAMRDRLLEALRQQQKPVPRKGLLVRMAQYRLPAWQVAAGLALLLGAYFGLQKPPKEVMHTETVYVNTTDTIYKEVAIPVAEQQPKTEVKRVNVKPRLVKATPNTADAIASADTSYRRASSLPDTMSGFQFTLQSPAGRSANEMKELWQLLGDVY